MSHRSFKNISIAQRIPITFSSAQALGKPTAVAIGANMEFKRDKLRVKYD